MHGIVLFIIGIVAGIGTVIFAMTGFIPAHRCMVPQCEDDLLMETKNYNWIDVRTTVSCERLDFNGSCIEYMKILAKNETLETSESVITCSKSEILFDRGTVKSTIVEGL